MPPAPNPAASDFREECEAIDALLAPLEPSDFDKATRFKGWTIGEIVEHLHLFNIAVDEARKGEAAFMAFCAKILPNMPKGHQALQRDWFGDTPASETYRAWRDVFPGLCDRFAEIDPDVRLKWFGPDMSARSAIIARQMEHWAHAQAIHDRLGISRVNGARLKNVAHIGVTTYSWSHTVNGLEPPKPKPHVRLTGPGGEVWEWNELQEDNRVEGRAEAFCQVVTQCRNVADVELTTVGETATRWMAIAQCFAGPKEVPPEPGVRRMESS
ncbi:MAG: TIGR03084 family metal-binding protein [Litorimonas sp.]